MKNVLSTVGLGLLLTMLPALGWAQSTDRSEMDQWVKDTANQGDVASWRQDHDVQLAAVQAVHAAWHAEAVRGQLFLENAAGRRNGRRPGNHDFLPKTWVEATEKYGPQTDCRSAAQRPLRDAELSRRHAFPESAGSEQRLEDPRQRLLGVTSLRFT